MAGSNNIYNNRDSMDINELAALNQDISPELIEQLQQKISQDADTLKNIEPEPTFNEKDDTTLFEEPVVKTEDVIAEEVVSDSENTESTETVQEVLSEENTADVVESTSTEEQNADVSLTDTAQTEQEIDTEQQEADGHPINKISEGKILEKTLTPEQKSYNDSLDYLDGNVKYSKYVIYIDPQNVDFIEGLTVKERKNLINKILREQDDISITKQRWNKARSIIGHAIVAIITLAVSVPIVYYAINASLEASINNYRRSQANFQTLYREKGKITNIRR